MPIYNRILIAIDDSNNSTSIVKSAFRLASVFSASCAIVNVIDTDKVSDFSEHFPLEVLTNLKDTASKTLNLIRSKYPDQKFEEFMPEDRPSKGIIKIASDWNADLIVIGTRGNSGIKRMILGSTAENTIRHSAIPILVIPPKN